MSSENAVARTWSENRSAEDTDFEAPNIWQRFANNRIYYLRLGGGLLMALLLLSTNRWPEDGIVEVSMFAFGYLLTTIAVFGRIWSALYINGYKGPTLVTAGPYSIVRNPLYLFSFVGFVGIGLVSESFVICVLVVLVFLAVHTPTVIREEKHLLAVFGESYRAYAANVPRAIPRFRQYLGSPDYTVRVFKFERALRDAIWFLWIPLFLEGIEKLHSSGYLPSLIQLP